jgi:hypothetical protein
MKKYYKLIFLSTFLVFFNNRLYAQIDTKFDCNIIECLFRVKYIKQRLFIDKYRGKVITIVDSNRFFGDCHLNPISGREIIFTNDSATQRSNRPFNFIIYKMSLSKGIYTIGLLNKYSGVQIQYVFKKKYGKYIFFKNESGQF